MSGLARRAGPMVMMGLVLLGGCGRDDAAVDARVAQGAASPPPPAAAGTAAAPLVAPRAASPASPMAAAPRRPPLAAATADSAEVAEVAATPAEETETETTLDMTAFEQAFAHEANDGDWAVRTSARLHAVAGASPRYAAVSHDLVDCKQTVCKLALGYDDPRAFEDYVAALLETMKDEPGGTLEFARHQAHGGRWAVIAYLARTSAAAADATPSAR